MVYWTHHYVIDWDKVQTVDDLKRLLRAMQISFDGDHDVSDIQDLVRLEPKLKGGLTL